MYIYKYIYIITIICHDKWAIVLFVHIHTIGMNMSCMNVAKCYEKCIALHNMALQSIKQ